MSTRRMHKTDGTTSHKNQTFRHRMQYPSVFSFLPIAVDFDLRGESAFPPYRPDYARTSTKLLVRCLRCEEKNFSISKFFFHHFFPFLFGCLMILIDTFLLYETSFYQIFLVASTERFAREMNSVTFVSITNKTMAKRSKLWL